MILLAIIRLHRTAGSPAAAVTSSLNVIKQLSRCTHRLLLKYGQMCRENKVPRSVEDYSNWIFVVMGHGVMGIHNIQLLRIFRESGGLISDTRRIDETDLDFKYYYLLLFCAENYIIYVVDRRRPPATGLILYNCMSGRRRVSKYTT